MLLASALGAGGFIWIVFGSIAGIFPRHTAAMWRLWLAVAFTFVLVDAVAKPLADRARPFESLPGIRLIDGTPDEPLIPIRSRGNGSRRSARGHADDSGSRLDSLAAGWCRVRVARLSRRALADRRHRRHGRRPWLRLVCVGRPAARARAGLIQIPRRWLAPSKSDAIYSEVSPIGQVAQLVEHATENRSVGGSIPSLATTYGGRSARDNITPHHMSPDRSRERDLTSRLLAGVDQDVQRLIIAGGTQDYAPDSTVRMDEPAEHLYVLLKGRVQLSRPVRSGHEVSSASSCRATCSVECLLTRRARYMGTAETVEAGEAMVWDRAPCNA